MSPGAGVTGVQDLVMPRLSDSMEEGKILSWLKPSGDTVARGDELAEIETDKATVVYEAEAEGVLEIVVPEGTTASIGTVIARLHPDGAAAPAGAGLSRAGAPDGAHSEEHAGSEDDGQPVAEAQGTPGTASTAAPLSGAQALIARRMSESRATVPDFSLEIEVDMSGALALHHRLKQSADPAPTLNDMIVKACALVLVEFPLANGSFGDDHFEVHRRVNVGVAVATDDSLVVPTVFDADVQSLSEIALTTRELARKVREATIAPAELSGATFTVSNLGMYGVRSFTAIINRPQAAILAAGAIQKRAVIRGDGVEVGDVMAATLACDHRILYGAYAARFLARIREVLEQADAMLT